MGIYNIPSSIGHLNTYELEKNNPYRIPSLVCLHHSDGYFGADTGITCSATTRT